jgi:hypothetical protein
MTSGEAKALTAKLLGAYQGNVQIDPVTAEVYLQRMQSFPSYERALEAIDDLTGSERFRPSVADLVERYYAYNERHQERLLELEMPEPTPEEKEANLKMAKEWLRRAEGVADSFEMP